MARNYSVWIVYNDYHQTALTVSADSEAEAKIKANDYCKKIGYKKWSITCVR